MLSVAKEKEDLKDDVKKAEINEDRNVESKSK